MHGQNRSSSFNHPEFSLSFPKSQLSAWSHCMYLAPARSYGTLPWSHWGYLEVFPRPLAPEISPVRLFHACHHRLAWGPRKSGLLGTSESSVECTWPGAERRPPEHVSVLQSHRCLGLEGTSESPAPRFVSEERRPDRFFWSQSNE